jgi:hypothetical protein
MVPGIFAGSPLNYKHSDTDLNFLRPHSSDKKLSGAFLKFKENIGILHTFIMIVPAFIMIVPAFIVIVPAFIVIVHTFIWIVPAFIWIIQ